MGQLLLTHTVLALHTEKPPTHVSSMLINQTLAASVAKLCGCSACNRLCISQAKFEQMILAGGQGASETPRAVSAVSPAISRVSGQGPTMASPFPSPP